MTNAKADDLGTRIMRVFFGICALVIVYALIDWLTTGNNFKAMLADWDALPHLVRLVIVCLGAGVVCMFGFWYALIRSAEPVDENECPIEVKKK